MGRFKELVDTEEGMRNFTIKGIRIGDSLGRLTGVRNGPRTGFWYL